MLTNLDLFGPPSALAQHHSTLAKQVARPRTEKPRWHDDYTLPLFEDLKAYLTNPMLPIDAVPSEFRTERLVYKERDEPSLLDEPEGNIEVDISERAERILLLDDDARIDAKEIKWQLFGKPWVIAAGYEWSREGIMLLQNRLFWESMLDFTCKGGELDKWSSLKWVFKPAIWKYYVWNKRTERSFCLDLHENDYPFSYHLCSMAAGMTDEEAIREGFRRNLAPELILAVERVCAQ